MSITKSTKKSLATLAWLAAGVSILADGTPDTVQHYSGNVSQTGTVLYMGGTFTALDAGGGSPGEYSFYASK